MEIIPRATWGARYPAGFGPAPLPADEVWLHHSVTIAPDLVPPYDDEYAAMRTLERIGQERFGGGISYTFACMPTGRMYEGTGVTRKGSHTGGRNSIARAIVLVGDHDAAPVSRAQIQSTASLLVYGYRQGWWRQPRLNGGHQQAPGASTGCPGRNGMAAIPTINTLAQQILNGEDLMAKLDPDDYRNIAAAVWNHDLGATKGGVPGDEVDLPAETARDRINAVRRAGADVRDRVTQLLRGQTPPTP